MPSEEISVQVAPGPGHTTRVIRVTGPLTLQTLFAFQNAVRREKGHFLVVDLIGVPYVDSAGGGSIVLAHVSSENAGKRLIVSGANERVRTVLQVTRVSQVLTLTPSVGEAEQALVDRDANP